MSAAAALLRGALTAPCHPWPRRVLPPQDWRRMAELLRQEAGLELLAMWADTTHVHALFHEQREILIASTAIDAGTYPALSPSRPAAAWFERMIRDLWGHHALGGRDLRPWLNHGRWRIASPLANRHEPVPPGAPEPPEFLPVGGEDLHQVAVGPVHAGIIEPGHFRFTGSGETVARLEVRLGYLHKGTLALMRGKSPRTAARFAARLSGDSTVAHALAFARASEAACGTDAPPRAAALRAVMAEIERVANHLGDCGAIANDAAFPLLLARFGWHREHMLRAADAAFGHRLMMDRIVPGGVAGDITPGGPDMVARALDALEIELPRLMEVYDDTSSLADRMCGTGTVAPDLVARFAAGGFVGRASGRDFDLRRAPGYAPYDRLAVSVPVLTAGDVDARVRIRVAEITESVRLLRALMGELPDGPLTLPLPLASGEGIGWAEGFRGDIWHWMRLDGGQITCMFMRDPSWLQWPLLEAAIRDNIIADFPLCNKSFNCSYSGVDL